MCLMLHACLPLCALGGHMALSLAEGGPDARAWLNRNALSRSGRSARGPQQDEERVRPAMVGRAALAREACLGAGGVHATHMKYMPPI